MKSHTAPALDKERTFWPRFWVPMMDEFVLLIPSMKQRRSFIMFVLMRLSVWVFIVVLGYLGLSLVGVVSGFPVEQFVAMLLGAVAVLFFEYDSLPRAISIVSSKEISVEDASGEVSSISEFALRRFLWLPRIVYCQHRKVVSLPLEAFESSRDIMRELNGEIVNNSVSSE